MEFALLGLVVLLAGGLRVYYIGTCADDGRGPEPLRVQDAPGENFTSLVRSLSQGRGFVRGGNGNGEAVRADVAPLYPWLVSQLSPTPGDTALLFQRVRWLQCGLGALTAGLLFLFARRAFASLSVALLAGLAGAVHPFWLVATAELADGVLAAFLLALALYLAARCRFREFAASWLFGLALAALALTRAALLPYALVSLLWFLHGCRSAPGRMGPALLAVFGFASGMAPWALHSYEATHRIFPIVDSTYSHLWIGNHPSATGGPSADAPPATEPEQARAVRDTVTGDAAGTVRRRLWAAFAFLAGEDWLTKQRLFEETPQASIPEQWLGYFRLLLPASLLLLLVLAVVGWRWSYASREKTGPAALAVILVPLPYILGHAEALSGPRLPLDGVLICLGAYAVIWIVAGLRGLRAKDL
jgi:hypothetical protein